MEPDKIATIAALAVALVALLVASAQAIQQYFVSGQLIRLCDSVVYNQMPGQGHRIWQFSQFRFRVVYSIPQIRLLPELWSFTATHLHSLPSDSARLPRLNVEGSKDSLAALAGEASWVSFVRAIQFSTGESLRYTMVEGDADRCPSDLPVVPMQLSMRDVVVVATMAGMECTDVSFQTQSLSMQGSAGTITSSRHPVLGALIHFAPKQGSEHHGIRSLDGNISPAWVARMLDVVTVAGRQLDQRDRKTFEEEEGAWIKATSDIRRLCDDTSARLEALAPSGTLRRRRTAKSTSSARKGADETSIGKNSLVNELYFRPQDGAWAFFDASGQPSNQDTNGSSKPPRQVDLEEHLEQSLQEPRTLARRLYNGFSKKRFGRRHGTLPVSEPSSGKIFRDSRSYSPGKIENGLLPTTGGRYLTSDALTTPLTAKISNNDTHLAPSPPGDSSPGKGANGKKDALAYADIQSSNQDKNGANHTMLPLTNGNDIVRRSSNASIRSGPSIESKGESKPDSRSEFVSIKLEKTIRQRQRERSQGRTQYEAERRLVLRQKFARPVRSKGQARNQLKGGERHGSRYHKLAIQESRDESSSPGSIVGKEARRGSIASGVEADMGEQSDDPKSPVSAVTFSDSPSSGLGNDAFSVTRKPEDDTTGVEMPHRPYKEYEDTQDGLDHIRRGRRRNSSLARSRKVEKIVRIIESPATIEPNQPWKPRICDHTMSPARKSVLRRPTERFPEDPAFIRQGVAPADSSRPGRAIPEGARWTKIDRRLVSPMALEAGRERYEAGEDHVIVLRVLAKAEIEQYALRTQEMRDLRAQPVETVSAATEEKSDDESSSEMSVSSNEQSEKEYYSRPDGFSSAEASVPFGGPDPDTAASNRQRKDDSGVKDDQTPDDYTSVPSDTDSQESNDENDIDQAKSTTSGHRDIYVEDKTGRSQSDRIASAKRSDVQKQPEPRQRHISASRQRSLRDENILTYDEEILFLRSDSILKQLKACTEQCKDVVTTIQFCVSLQADFDDDAGEVREIIKSCNTYLKKLLMVVEPLRDTKKAAEIIVADLDVLLHGFQACLGIVQKEFDLFDITPLSNHERKVVWKRTLDAFEDRYRHSLLDSLVLGQNLAAEVASNFKIGIFKSPESALWKKRLAQACDYKDLPTSPTSPLDPLLDTPRFRSRLSNPALQSPSRVTQSPSPSSITRYSTRRPRKDAQRSKDSRALQQQHQARTSQDKDGRSAAIQSSRYNDSSSDSQSFASTDTLTSWEDDATGEMSWFWISQANVLPGYFATPWKSSFSDATCIGAISVFLTALETYTNQANLRYVKSHEHCKSWIHQGRTTYPSYAHGANGGIVVAGRYEAVEFEAFKGRRTPPIDLLQSYDYRIERNYAPNTQAVIASTAELMSLDSWLSISGRHPEITDGHNCLLQTLPTLIQRTMRDFDLEFGSVDRASRGGGSRIIKTISASLLQFLGEQGLKEEAEQLFTLVAMMRTVKMALCVARGTDTVKLREVLVQDMQVYLA